MAVYAFSALTMQYESHCRPIYFALKSSGCYTTMFLKRRENGWSSGRCAGVSRFRPWPLVRIKIISFFIRDIHRYLSQVSRVYIRFRPRLLFMFTFPSIKQHYRVSRYGAPKTYLVSLNEVTLFSSLFIKMFGQSGLINMLFTFFFSQSTSITMFFIPTLTISAHSL